jgi:flavodoxin
MHVYIYIYIATHLKNKIKSFCTLFASISIDSKLNEIKPNRNFNNLVSWQPIRFGLDPKTETKSFDLVWNRIISRRTHEVDNQIINDTNKISVSIISNTRQYSAIHIKQNIQKCFDLSTRDVVSRSLLATFFISLQTSVEIDVFCSNLKKIRKNEKLKNKKRNLIFESKHVAKHEFTKEHANERIFRWTKR